MPVRFSAQRTTFTTEQFDEAGGGETSPLFAIADQRGPGAEYYGKPSLDVAGAALQLTRAGLSWSALGTAATISFAFRAGSTGMPSSVQGFTNFTTVQIQSTLLALQSWSDVAGLTFVRQDDGTGYSDNATILFGNYSTGAEGSAAFAYLPGSTAASSVAGDLWVNSSLSYNAAPAVWGYGQLTLVHEIGHTLGLLHPGDYDAEPGVSITYAADATYAEDSNQYTVMSYFRETVTGASFGAGRYAAAPLLDDIAAAQRLYGANMSTRTGDTTYGFNSTADRAWFSASASAAAPIFAIWDAGGIDTLDFSGYSGGQLLDLRQGAFSNFGTLIGNVSIAIGAVIENAIGGAGSDLINGNSADNRITPGGGSNQVDGGLGTDTLVFAGARSAYTINVIGQQIFVYGPEGSTQFRNVEFLAFSDMTIAAPQGDAGVTVSGDMTNDTVNGTGFDDTLSGGGGNDVMQGFDGADQLTGGRGNDTVDGGTGNDLIYLDQGDDVIIGGGGIQDALSTMAALSGLNINLQLGTISGGGLGVDSVSGIEWVHGSRFNDVIVGGAENNRLDGSGGSDVLRGGDGNDELIASWGEAGGAADLIKAAGQANDSIGNAVSLDAAFDHLARDGVLSPTTPHATVVATTHGGREYYAFTVGANTDVSFDIDGATFDSTIRIFDASGSELAANDDAQYTGDEGARTDSFLNFRFVAAGTYYVQVGQWDANLDVGFTTVPPPAGQSYTLHVTVPGHAVQPTYPLGSELHGDAGNDILRSSVGSDTLDGGSGADTAVFTGMRSAYTISLSGGVTTVSNGEASDTVTNVERLQFADMVTDAAGIPEAPPIAGTENADTLNGTDGDDIINGLGGADRINGAAGNDQINGGLGNDILFGGLGSDIVRGAEGNDRVSGGDGADALEGGDGGIDTVDYSADYGGVNVNLANGVGAWNAAQGDTLTGFENIIGTAFGDVLTGDSAYNRLAGGAGADQLNGAAGIDTADYSADYGGVNVNLATGAGLWNAAQGDVLTGIEDLIGTAFGDVLSGDAGDNRLTGGLGADQLNGGAGADVADYTAEFGAVNVNLATGVGVWNAAHGDSLTGIESVIGTAYGDVLTGDAGDNRLWGGAGANQLNGGGGADLLEGGGDDDRLIGGVGADQLLGWGGADWLWGGDGADQLNGSFGSDTADYSADFGGVNVNLANGVGLWNAAHGDTLIGIENLVGTTYGDVLTGDTADNRLAGGLGADQLNGGAGRDTADYSADYGAVEVNLINAIGLWNAAHGDVLTGIENVTGTAWGDVLIGDAADNRLDGQAGADQLDGGTGNDELIGGDGDDRLWGGVGADQLHGGAGFDTVDYSAEYGAVNVNLAAGAGVWNAAHGDTLTGIEHVIGTSFGDVLTGDAANNRLNGGQGDDQLSGGAGNDVFVFDDGFNRDRITDFKSAGGADVVAFAAGLFTGFDDLMAHAVQAGSDVVITLGDNSLTLTGVQRSSLQSGDFTFGVGSAPAQAAGQPADASAKLPAAFDDAWVMPGVADDPVIGMDAWDPEAIPVAQGGSDVLTDLQGDAFAPVFWSDEPFSAVKLHDAFAGRTIDDPWG